MAVGAMEILSSRVLLRPRDLERTRDFYARILDLPVYRQFGSDEAGGVVFFAGGGFIEISGASSRAATDATQLWLQVRALNDVYRRLSEQEVPIEEPPVTKPWGLHEMRARDPDGRLLVFVEVPPRHPLRRDSRDGMEGTSPAQTAALPRRRK